MYEFRINGGEWETLVLNPFHDKLGEFLRHYNVTSMRADTVTYLLEVRYIGD